MYTPRFNQLHDESEIRRLVAAARTAWFVTTDAAGMPVATLLPIVWRGDVVIAHLARANRQWRDLAPDAPALLIVGGPDAYVSPSWYASKAEHGKVVPTWNYTAAHLSGTVTVHTDQEWLRHAVTELTDTHESGRAHPWAVSDAPDDYVDLELSGIVGIEVRVTKIEGKAKLSQNRSDADRQGVIDGLAAEEGDDASAIADAMRDGLGQR